MIVPVALGAAGLAIAIVWAAFSAAGHGPQMPLAMFVILPGAGLVVGAVVLGLLLRADG